MPGLNLDPAEIAEAFVKLNWDESTVKPLPSVKSILSESKLLTEKVELVSKTKDLLSKELVANQKAEIENMIQTYENWDRIRNEELEKQVKRFKEIQTLLDIQVKKKELSQQEDTIFFFDNEEKWMMRQPKEKPIEPEERLDSKGRRRKVKKPKEDDSSYISPDV